MKEDIEIKFHYYDESIKFNDTLVIISHPTIGMISSITANYLVDHLDLKLVGAILSDKLHPTAIIKNGRPVPPIRIFAGEYKDDPETDFDQLVVISSDLPIEKELLAPLADELIKWCQENNATSALTIEGINKENMDLGGEAKVYHVPSIEKAGDHLDGMGAELLTNGMVSGLSGLLLYKGNIKKFPIISLLSEAHKNFPDSRSAAAILEVLNKMVPKIEMDHEPLLEQAEDVENKIRDSLSQIRQGDPKRNHVASQGMYA